MQIAIFAIVLILFLGFAIAGGKTWQWWHVALKVLVLLTAATFMVLVGITVRTNANWSRVHDTLSKRIEVETEKRDALKYPSLARPGQSVPEVRGELGRMILDRGRVWRGVTPVGIEGETITINTAGWGKDECATLGIEADDAAAEESFLEPDGAEGGAAPVQPIAARPHGIEQGVVLIAYLQVPVAELDEAQRKALFRGSNLLELDTNKVCHVPAFYLGDYKVTATTADSVSLQPVTRLAQDQIDVISQSVGKTWALYELMPIDRHDIFSGSPELHVEAGGDAATGATSNGEQGEDAGFDGESSGFDVADIGLLEFPGYTEAELRALFPQSSMNLPDADYEALIQEYARDQRPVGPNASYPKERLLKKVRFLQDYTVEVDVAQPDPSIERSYDPSGRAQLPHLRHGSAVVFKKDDVSGYMDAAAADELIRNGVAEEVEDTTAIYNRVLRDYLYSFREHEFQMNLLDQEIAIVQEDKQKVLDATEKLRKQIDYRTQERNNLNEDLTGFSRELTEVQAYRTTLEKKIAEQRQELSELYRTNRELMRRLQASHATKNPAAVTADKPTPAVR
jgi:hypothetical protein